MQGNGGGIHSHLIPLAVDTSGKRYPTWEHQIEQLSYAESSNHGIENAGSLLKEHVEPMIQRELFHRGLVDKSYGYGALLIGWIEIV